MKSTNNIIWEQLKPFKKKAIFLMVVFLISSGITAIIPAIYGNLVDRALNGVGFQTILIILGFWLVLSLLGSWFERYGSRHAQVLAVEIEKSFLVKLTDHFLHLPYSYLKDQQPGKMIKSFDRASGGLENIIRQILFFFLPDLLAIILVIIFMVKIHWILSLALLIISILYIIITVFKSKDIVHTSKKLNFAYQTAYGSYYGNINDYQTIRAFSAEDVFINTFIKDYKRISKWTWEVSLSWNKLSILTSSIHYFSFVGLFGVGIYLMSAGAITPGNLVSYVGYAAFSFGILGRLGNYYAMYQRNNVDILAAHKLLAVKREVDDRSDDIEEIDDISGEIVFKNVSFNYAEKKQKAVLRGVDFTVKPGEVIALVGESGSGKTTLVDLISGYYLPTKGKILIDGHNTRSIDGKELRRYISLVPQEVSLFHESIAFNIKYGKRDAKMEDIRRIGVLTNVDDFVKELPKGYQSKVGERGVKLSVGQKQRIAIARALIREPKILILDEATSSLDSVTEKKVQEALDVLIKDRTTFIIAHRLSTIVNADRILVLKDGKIAEMGKHSELLKKDGEYARLYNAQKF